MRRNEPFDLPPALDFLQRLWELNHALERFSSQMEKALGATAQQRLILRCIDEFPGVAPGQLAAILHVDAGTVSASLRRLTAKALVRREVDASDKRRGTLKLTKRGLALAQMLSGTVEGAVQRLLAMSPAGEVAGCKAVITKLSANLRRDSANFVAKPKRAR